MAPSDRDKVGQFQKRMKRKNQSEASVLIDQHNDLANMCAGETGESDDCPFDDRTNLAINESRSSRKERRRILEFGVLLSNLKSRSYCKLGHIPLTYDNEIGEI